MATACANRRVKRNWIEYIRFSLLVSDGLSHLCWSGLWHGAYYSLCATVWHTPPLTEFIFSPSLDPVLCFVVHMLVLHILLLVEGKAAQKTYWNRNESTDWYVRQCVSWFRVSFSFSHFLSLLLYFFAAGYRCRAQVKTTDIWVYDAWKVICDIMRPSKNIISCIFFFGYLLLNSLCWSKKKTKTIA